ncbi:hypothetical protein TSUD_136170 [Trifolium subterraneum]|uniref:Uncharacterized protein n=1 Tax=Trifolium subterraneum TaxID=3900 RepID=A0A2Z6PIR7_TRISU|nr:hypothetical protein TSUD_136170 [Trifolium subterraneum]
MNQKATNEQFMSEIKKYVNDAETTSSRVLETSLDQQKEQSAQPIVPKGKSTTIRKKRKIEKASTPSDTKETTGEEDQGNRVHNKELKESISTPPPLGIAPEFPVATEDSSLKDVTVDVLTSITKEDLGTTNQSIDNVTQDVVTSGTGTSPIKNVSTSKVTTTTEEISKKDNSRDVPSSVTEKKTIYEARSVEDPKESSREDTSSETDEEDT